MVPAGPQEGCFNPTTLPIDSVLKRALAQSDGEFRPGPNSAAHNAVGLAGECPVVGFDCLST
jgi:hypothetical protein